MLSLKRVSGKPVLDSELRQLGLAPHRVEAKVAVRTEDRADWLPLKVSEATVRLFSPGFPAEVDLTCVAPVVFNYVKAGDTWRPTLTSDQPEVTPWGSWLRVQQHIFTPGIDTDPIIVPWGMFMVEAVETVNNTQRIVGRDALAALLVAETVPLSLQRVVKNADIATRIAQLIQGAWPAGTDPWASLVSWDAWAQAPGNTPSRKDGADQYDTGRWELVQSLARRIGMTVIADPEMLFIYRIVSEFNHELPSTHPSHWVRADLYAGNGLVKLTERKTREGIVNRDVLLWEYTNKAETRRTQRRTQVDLVAAGPDEAIGKIYIGQRFGVQSKYETSADVSTQSEARRHGQRTINMSLAEAALWNVETVPVYGLRPDDVVAMRDAYSNTGRGRVVGMTVNLMHTGNWTVDVEPINRIASKTFGGPQTEILKTDYLKWRALNSPKIDEDCKTTQGWAATGGKIYKTKTGMRAQASSTTMTLNTVSGYTATRSGVARVSAQVGKVPEKCEVRATVDGQSGDWVEIEAGKSKTVNSGEQKVSGSFAVKVEFRNIQAGKIFDLNGITVEVPA